MRKREGVDEGRVGRGGAVRNRDHSTSEMSPAWVAVATSRRRPAL